MCDPSLKKGFIYWAYANINTFKERIKLWTTYII